MLEQIVQEGIGQPWWAFVSVFAAHVLGGVALRESQARYAERKDPLDGVEKILVDRVSWVVELLPLAVLAYAYSLEAMVWYVGILVGSAVLGGSVIAVGMYLIKLSVMLVDSYSDDSPSGLSR